MVGNPLKSGGSNGSSETTSQALVRDVGEFADGVLTLAELQAELFVVNVKECSRNAVWPSLALLCGLALGLACFPIVLVALGLCITQYFETSYTVGFFVAAAAGMSLSVLLCVVGATQVQKHLAPLQRSKQELIRNLGWIKKVLKHKRITRKVGVDNPWRTGV